MIPPVSHPQGGSRSGGRVPPVSPLRSTYLTQPVTPRMRLTSLGLALAGVIAALVFCGVIWVTLWTLGEDYFIAALSTVCVIIGVLCIAEKNHK